MTNDTTTLAEALIASWGASRQPFAELDRHFLILYHYLDKFTRGKDRFELIRAIKDVNVQFLGMSRPITFDKYRAGRLTLLSSRM